MQGNPPTDNEEMHGADVPGQPQRSLSEGDADGDARDFKETQHRGCFGRDASVEEQLARFARAASTFVDERLVSRMDRGVAVCTAIAWALSH